MNNEKRDYHLRAEIDADALKVADFIAANVHPNKVHAVAKWVAELAPMIWPMPEKNTQALAPRQTPTDIIRFMS